MTRALAADDRSPLACRAGGCEHRREVLRLRRDLHDGLGPGLAGIMMRADVLTRLLADDRDAAEEVLLELRREAAAFLAEFRRVLADRDPAELDGHELGDALRALGRRMGRASGNTLRVRTEVDRAAVTADRAARVAAFWIVREALTNVVRHARARRCVVRVWVDGGLRLEVTDDGIGGIGIGGGGLTRPGIGLASMGGRAAELGGTCEVRDNVGPGVTVTAHLPEPAPGDGARP